jgi:hypothetical protein
MKITHAGRWLWAHPKRAKFIGVLWVIFIFLPPFASGVWALFSDKPLFLVLSKLGFPMPVFSIMWITGPIGLVMLFAIFYLLATGKPRANQTYSPLYRIDFDYLPELPVNHGWKLVKEEKSEDAPEFFNVPNESPISTGLTIKPNGWYGLEHDIIPQALVSNHLKFSAKFASDSRIYARVRVSSRDGAFTKSVWLRFFHSDVAKMQAFDPKSEEYGLSISGKRVSSGWVSYDVSLVDEVNRAMGEQGLIFQQILKVRLRGPMSISAIELDLADKVSSTISRTVQT